MVLLIGVLFFAQAKVRCPSGCAVDRTRHPPRLSQYSHSSPSNRLRGDHMYSMSVATRLTMQIWTGIVLLHFPFGVGFSGFLPAMKIYVLDAAAFLQSLSPFPLNFNEVSGYALQCTRRGREAFLANYAAYFGFPFLFLAGRFCVCDWSAISIDNEISRCLRAYYFSSFSCALRSILSLTVASTSPSAMLFCQCRKYANPTSAA